MQDLVGLRFKRNKYGLSVWEDRIKKVEFSCEIEKRLIRIQQVGFIPRIHGERLDNRTGVA